MEKIDEIENRMFILKKRLRQPEMREIFESGNKSIIEVYERICKTKTSKNIKDDSNLKYEVKKNTPTLKVIKETNIITKPSFITTNDKELSIDKPLDKEEISQVRTISSAKGKTSNDSFTSSKFSNLIDKGKISSEVSQFKDTNTSSSEKNQEKNRDNTSKSKSQDRRTQKSQNKIQPLPANNLLNIDEWQNSDKFPLVKNSNFGFTNSKLNIIKTELISGNTDLINGINANMIVNNNSGKNAGLRINRDIPANPLTNNQLDKNIKDKKLEIEIKNENLGEKNIGAITHEENNITVDDSFYDQKEDLFVNNLPPEVMGGTPEFEKDEEMHAIKNEENHGFKNVQKKVEESLSKIKFEEKNENHLNNNKEETKHSNHLISTKITIPNTFNNETIFTNNYKPNNLKKNVKIIDDEEDEETVNNANIPKKNPISSENLFESVSNSNSNFTSSKIKIPIDIKDFKSPLISEGAKSAKSSKSYEEITNFNNTNNSQITQNLNLGVVNNSSPQDFNKTRDPENKNYNTIVIDRKNLKNFKKIDASQNAIDCNVAITDLGNTGNIVNNLNIERVYKKNQVTVTISPNAQANKAKLNKKPEEIFESKRVQSGIDSKIKLTYNNPQNKTTNVSNNQTVSNKHSTNESSQSVQSGQVSLNTEKKQETIIHSRNNISNSSNIFHKEPVTGLNNTVTSLHKSSSNNQTSLNNNSTNNPITHLQPQLPKNEFAQIDPILNNNEKIEKKNPFACFIISVNETITKFKERVFEYLSKNQSLLISKHNEYDLIKSSILDTMTEDNSIKGIKILSEKFSKLIIKLFEFLNVDEVLEKFNLELIPLLDSANEFFKKALVALQSEKHGLKILKSLKILFKFLMNLLKMKSFKNKLNQIVSDAENFLKENKKSADKNLTQINNLLKFCKLSKSFNRSVEKMQKLLQEIKEEESKNKTRNKNSNFNKEVEKSKEYLMMNPNHIAFSKCQKLVRNFYDLIFNYLNED